MDNRTQKAWWSLLETRISKMGLEELYTQFIIQFLSDRAFLYFQWSHLLYKHVLFRSDKQRIHLWFDDILNNPIQFECFWNIPEAELGNISAFNRFGIVRCFAKHGTHDEIYGSRAWLTRSMDSLDGFTLLLLTELIHRQKMKFNEITRPEFGRVELRLSFDTYNLPLNAELVREARIHCFKHIVLMSLTIPFLLVNVPDHKVTLLNGRSILDLSLAASIAFMGELGQYLAVATSQFHPDQLWLFNMAHCFSLLHSRQTSHTTQFLKEVACPCQLCSILKSIFSKYYVIQLNEHRHQNLTNGNLVLAYFHNIKLKQYNWYNPEEDLQMQADFIRERTENIQKCFHEFGHDTYSLKQYNHFREKWDQLMATKKRKFEQV